MERVGGACEARRLRVRVGGKMSRAGRAPTGAFLAFGGGEEGAYDGGEGCIELGWHVVA